MNQRLAAILEVVVVCAVGGTALGDQASITSAGDTTLYSESGTLSNGAGEHMFTGFTSGGPERRSLIRFDIAQAIPAHSTINSVSLTLALSTTTTATSTVSLHRLVAGWGEGTSNAGEPGGQGTTGTPGDATWTTSFLPGTLWFTPGGDFAPVASASLSVPGTLGTYTWASAAMAADVQAWLDTPPGNFGWVLVTAPGTRNAKRFDTHENADRDARPVLLVDFTPPCPADLDDGSGTGTPDGGVDINDLLFFLARYEGGC